MIVMIIVHAHCILYIHTYLDYNIYFPLQQKNIFKLNFLVLHQGLHVILINA